MKNTLLEEVTEGASVKDNTPLPFVFNNCPAVPSDTFNLAMSTELSAIAAATTASSAMSAAIMASLAIFAEVMASSASAAVAIDPVASVRLDAGISFDPVLIKFANLRAFENAIS